MCNFFGGASGGEKANAAAQEDLARSLTANYKQMFGEQSATMDQLNSVINRIQSGDTGPGFGAAEENARESMIMANAAAAERNAQQAVQNRAAGQQFEGAGDTSGLAHAGGIRQQVNAEIAAAGENQKSAALNANQAANFEQGRLNAAQTEGGLARLAGLQDPMGYARGAQEGNQSAFGMRSKINEEESSGGLFGGLLKAGIGMAGKFISGGRGNLDDTGGSSTSEQFGNFFKGGFGGS